MMKNTNEIMGTIKEFCKKNKGSIKKWAFISVVCCAFWTDGYFTGHKSGSLETEDKATAVLMDMERDGAVTFYDTEDGIEDRKFTGMYSAVDKYIDDEYLENLNSNR